MCSGRSPPFPADVTGAVTIGNSLPEIAAVADECRRIAERIGLDASATADVQVALDEIVSNAIRYAFPEGERHSISVRFRVVDAALEVTIEYSGVAFDPANAPPPDRSAPLAQRRVGGLGAHFARELMDEIRYRRVGELNRVTLVRGPTPPEGGT